MVEVSIVPSILNWRRNGHARLAAMAMLTTISWTEVDSVY